MENLHPLPQLPPLLPCHSRLELERLEVNEEEKRSRGLPKGKGSESWSRLLLPNSSSKSNLKQPGVQASLQHDPRIQIHKTTHSKYNPHYSCVKIYQNLPDILLSYPDDNFKS
jgi:hypothetical protein